MTALHQTGSNPNPAEVLTVALINAGKEMGLTQATLGAMIGKDRTSLSRGLDPTSKSGELALLLIRCYRALFVLVGGDSAQMRHWLHTYNHHTGGIPATQMLSIQGLMHVLEYLDAIRGKI